MSHAPQDAIDLHLADAESQFDVLIRELGGTPAPSSAQVARAVKAWMPVVEWFCEEVASTAITLGRSLAAWGEAMKDNDQERLTDE